MRIPSILHVKLISMLTFLDILRARMVHYALRMRKSKSMMSQSVLLRLLPRIPFCCETKMQQKGLRLGRDNERKVMKIADLDRANMPRVFCRNSNAVRQRSDTMLRHTTTVGLASCSAWHNNAFVSVSRYPYQSVLCSSGTSRFRNHRSYRYRNSKQRR